MRFLFSFPAKSIILAVSSSSQMTFRQFTDICVCCFDIQCNIVSPIIKVLVISNPFCKCNKRHFNHYAASYLVLNYYLIAIFGPINSIRIKNSQALCSKIICKWSKDEISIKSPPSYILSINHSFANTNYIVLHSSTVYIRLQPWFINKKIKIPNSTPNSS